MTDGLFPCDLLPSGSPRGRDMWNSSFVALMWIVWKERNARCFEGESANVHASWMLVLPGFKGFSIDQFMINWRREVVFPILEMSLGM